MVAGELQPIADGPLDEALALNNAHAVELSWQTSESFSRLVETAFLAAWTPDRNAFLIAFDQSAAYGSPNFLWFRDRLDRFIYVDRVVVRPEARGRGLAGQLYHTLFIAARNAGQSVVVCEVNADPPNPASDALHAKLGFREIGLAGLPGGAKTVRYLRLDLAPENN
jgi:predicted GNAT superfamily acetyltransferase